MNIKNWSIKRKIAFLSTLITGMVVLVGGIAFVGIRELEKELINVTAIQLPAVRAMTLTDMMHDGIRANVLSAILTSESKTPEKVSEVRAELDEFTTNINTYMTELKNLELTEAEKNAVAVAFPELEAYVKSAKDIVETALTVDKSTAMAKMPLFQEKFEALEEKLGALGEMVEADAAKHQKLGAEIVQFVTILISATIIIGFLFSVFSSTLIIRTISKSLQGVSDKLKKEASQVYSASENITTASQSLAQSTTQQAAALQETASSMEEITAMVKKSSENAKSSGEISEASRASASKGKDVSDEMLLAIDHINRSNSDIMKQIEESNRQISEIVKVIQEIGSKTKVINDIVFQTKLLSFNASVEAARAGEHGKGFAVVAEEVGNLAQMSGNAAKEIGDMLNGSIQKVETIVQDTKVKVERLVQEGRAKVDSGTAIAKNCAEILDQVVKSVTEVTQMTSEITTATHEQTQGISEINKAMNQLDQVTHENAAASQQAASAAEQLSGRARTLLSVVQEVEALIHGQNGSPPPENTSDDSPKGNVVSISKYSQPTKEIAKDSPKIKKAVGGESIPDENDPRFTDI